MNKNKQITKNQHHVPQFYLKKFTNKDNKLEILDCKRRKIVTPRSPKSVCSEEYFYSVNNEFDEISQILEAEFGKIETKISQAYDKIAEKFISFKQITENDKMLVATFMSFQYLRGPYMRQQIRKMSEESTKLINKSIFDSPMADKIFDRYELGTGNKISKKQREAVSEFATKGEYEVETNNLLHLRMMGEIEGFRNLFFGKDWLVFISKSNKNFVTSDNPVIELFPEWTGKTFYGPTFSQRIQQFAMMPDILIIATDPQNPSAIGKVKRKTLFDNKEHNRKILELNFQHPRNATAYVYANNYQLLQDIVDSANLYDEQQQARLKTMIRDSM